MHCAQPSKDGLIYVCDRVNDRLQVFKTDGTFVKEVLLETNTQGDGSVWEIALSRDPQQKYMYIADGANHKIHVFDRPAMTEIYSFGSGGRQPGEWYALHSIATDSKGNIYTTETYRGQRVQKFTLQGPRSSDGDRTKAPPGQPPRSKRESVVTPPRPHRCVRPGPCLSEMARIAVILAVTVFCLYTTPPPNPRVRAALDALSSRHSHQVGGDTDGSFYCPMEPDVRSNRPGKCPRCGMTLVEGVPDILEYPLDLALDPVVPHPNELTRLTFGLIDPRTERPVRKLEIVHEKLYHVFMVSQDLSFFLHTHPERQGDEDFRLDVRLPKPGMYRVLSDFYPSGATPQLVTNTVIVPGAGTATDSAQIQADLSPEDD